MAHVLFVSKDTGSKNVTLRAALCLSRQGVTVSAVVEGMSGKDGDWNKVTVLFKGTDDFRTMPFTVDALKLLIAIKPDVVVCGESKPINLEWQFAQTARNLNIPVVAVDDLWGGFNRLGVKPDLLCTVDDFGALLASNVLPDTRIVQVGNPGVPSPATYDMLKNASNDEYESLRKRFDMLVLFAGGDKDSMHEELKLLMACLAVTSGNWCLITRFHPKWATTSDPESDGKTYGDVWNEVLKPLGERVVDGTGKFAKTSEQLIALSDITVAGISTLLTTAAALGKPAASLSVPSVLQAIREEANLPEVPQTALGWAARVTAPTDLTMIQPASAEARKSLQPFDHEKVVKAILELLDRTT